MKLWEKGELKNELFERFTIGSDPILDLELAYFDLIGSIAHVKMLKKIELLTTEEADLLIDELEGMKVQASNGKFIIEEGVEDCHSQIELELTRKLGDVGKKVHSGRSRNDQVLTALKLFTKAQLEKIAAKTKDLFQLLQEKSDGHKDALMPGYTHMQVAMPSSFGLWFGAYAESLCDDLIQLKAAHKIADKSPLGSAAGYGSSFPLDREYSAKEMNFSTLNYNVVYAQMTRGKLEKTTAAALGAVASTLAKFAMDVCLYAGQNYEFLQVQTSYTTGSSIMPHKQNPDGFELVRAKCNQLQALPYELNLILTNLPSGYHRDLQILKEHYLPAFQTLKNCLDVVIEMTGGLKVNHGVTDSSKYDQLFTVEEVNELVLKGVPFRDAYVEVAESIKLGNYVPNRNMEHSHIGSIGCLANEEIASYFNNEWGYFDNLRSGKV
ncbi:MAG: argininosuccinate lyase [Cyclobacteriaceae bacterium]